MASRTKHCPTCGQHYDPAALFCQLDGALLRDDRPSLTPDLVEGEALLGHVLLDQFRLDAVLGAGGMGTVYRARQLGCDRDVAVKILHPEVARDPEGARRFEREARVSAQITHPNVVDVLLFGRLADGRSYLVMEYLEGRSLADLLDEAPRVAPARAARLLAQLADGLGAAHRRGVVHRDVKPENVVVRDPGTPGESAKLLDFGVARCLWGEHTMATETGLVFGTARYVSPEGAAGETTDARSDVYALGVLAWQMLAGRLPFDAESPVSILLLHVNQPPPPLPTDVPGPLADVVMGALRKDPAARPADGDALAAALRAAVAGEGVHPGPAPSIPSAAPGPASSRPAARGSHATLLEAGLAATDPLPTPVPASPPPPSAAPRGPWPDPARASSPPTAPTRAPAPPRTLAPSPRPGPAAALVWLSAFLVGAATVAGAAWALGALERPEPPLAAAAPAEPPPRAAPAPDPAPPARPTGVRVEPSSPVAGRPATLVAVLGPGAEVAAGAEGRFRLTREDRRPADRVVEAHAVAGGGFAASASFPRAGAWRVVFEIPLAPGAPSETLTASTEVRVAAPPRPAVAGRRRPVPPRRPEPAPAPPRTRPAAIEDPGPGTLRWELAPAIDGADDSAPPVADPAAEPPEGHVEPPAPPAPWTADGADLL